MRMRRRNAPLANTENVHAPAVKKSTLMRKTWSSLELLRVSSVDPLQRYVRRK
jgi:hypothetical protein